MGTEVRATDRMFVDWIAPACHASVTQSLRRAWEGVADELERFKSAQVAAVAFSNP